MLLSSISGRNLGDPNKQACFFDLADNSKMQDSNSVFFIFVGFDPLIWSSPQFLLQLGYRSGTGHGRGGYDSAESYRSRPRFWTLIFRDVNILHLGGPRHVANGTKLCNNLFLWFQHYLNHLSCTTQYLKRCHIFLWTPVNVRLKRCGEERRGHGEAQRESSEDSRNFTTPLVERRTMKSRIFYQAVWVWPLWGDR